MKLRALLATAALIGAVPAVSAIANEPVCPTVKAPDIAFDPPSYIDTNRAGGEPVAVVAQDGSIIVSAHAGTTHIYKDPNAGPGAGDFLVDYGNQTLHWRSTDGGKTWKYTGLLGQPAGPHTAQSTGFSDPDLTMDLGGRIYDVEINLANDSVFSSVDDGQSWPHGNPASSVPGDRPWITGLDKDEVFLYVSSLAPVGKAAKISRDGGLTWTNLPQPAISSKAVRDPLNPKDGLIGPVGLGRFAISDNDGQSWETYDFGELGRASQFFGVVGADSAGNVYQAAAGGYSEWNDTTPNGEVSFTYYERATGNTNGEEKVVIPTPPGDAMWPWIVAGDKGRAAVVWYQNLAGAPEKFYIYAAVTDNATGTEVTCSDGSKKLVPPQFTVVNASQRPIHEGNICLDGTACNANPSFDGGDRRLGDFFSVNFDHKGNLIIVSADTMLKNPAGGPKPVGNPIFIKQSSGDRMLEEPMTLRNTRPLCNNPVTCN